MHLKAMQKTATVTNRFTEILALLACQVGLHANMQSMRVATPLDV